MFYGVARLLSLYQFTKTLLPSFTRYGTSVAARMKGIKYKLVLIALATGLLLYTIHFLATPSAEQFDQAYHSLRLHVQIANGQLEVIDVVDNLEIEIEDVPEHCRQALLTMEDRCFYEHWGISLPGIARAALTVIKGGPLQGGSTITQQLAKNVFYSPERYPMRKLREILLALKLEIAYEKDEILQMYMNQIYLGEGAYGLEAAARTFFRKAAKDLTLYECT